jgi:hypothetical protein
MTPWMALTMMLADWLDSLFNAPHSYYIGSRDRAMSTITIPYSGTMDVNDVSFVDFAFQACLDIVMIVTVRFVVNDGPGEWLRNGV